MNILKIWTNFQSIFIFMLWIMCKLGLYYLLCPASIGGCVESLLITDSTDQAGPGQADSGTEGSQ